MNPSATSHRRNRTILTAMGAGLVGAGLFLTPAAAFAGTGQTVVQTTDPAGDARADQLSLAADNPPEPDSACLNPYCPWLNHPVS